MAFASIFIVQFFASVLAFSAIAIIIIFLIYISIKSIFYILQSIGLYNISKINGYKYPFIAWIPCISQYIIGRYNKNSKFGVLYSGLTIMKYLLIIALFIINNDIIFYLFLTYLAIYFIFDMFIMNMFYKTVFKNHIIYTIITVCTLGFAKPIFIFIAKFKIKNDVTIHS